MYIDDMGNHWLSSSLNSCFLCVMPFDYNSLLFYILNYCAFVLEQFFAFPLCPHVEDRDVLSLVFCMVITYNIESCVCSVLCLEIQSLHLKTFYIPCHTKWPCIMWYPLYGNDCPSVRLCPSAFQMMAWKGSIFSTIQLY